MIERTKKNRPRIGLALSGASGRAIAHIGVLEVLDEHRIPVDIITACSSGTVVAASYATGRMELLKNDLYHMDKQDFFELLDFDPDGGGVFSLERGEQALNKYTDDKNFQDVKPMLSFVSCDLDTGESVGLNLGNIGRAARVSCSVPGIFSPAKWGNRLLVDGGLFSLVPVEEAKRMGADIVIGVDIAATKYMFQQHYIYLYQGFNFVKKIIVPDFVKKLLAYFGRLYEKTLEIAFYNQSDFLLEHPEQESVDLLEVISKSMEIAIRRRKENREVSADIMLAPEVKHYGKMDFENLKKMYEEGRRVAKQAVPEIKKLIKEHEWKRSQEKAVQEEINKTQHDGS